MRKKIFYVYLYILMIAATAFQVTGSLNNVKNVEMESDNCYNLVEENLVKGSVGSDWLEKKILASDGASHNYFGWTSYIDGDHALVGAPCASNDQGAVYAFKRDGTDWFEEQKLIGSDTGPVDNFGCSVSIDGDYAIIGCEKHDGDGYDHGSAYIFKLDGSTWSEEENLFASDGATGDQFGYSVSIDGDYAIVGAFNDDDNGDGSGSAYIFKEESSGWVEVQKLTASDGSSGDWFGYSVSIDGDYAAVGAFLVNNSAGALYIFKNNGSSWFEEQIIIPSDCERGDNFARSICINGDYVFAGSAADDDHGGMSGSAYIFKNTGSSWVEAQKLTDPQGEEGDLFGRSVSINEDYAIVGASGDDGGTGSAHVFKNDVSGWMQEKKLTASDGQTADDFGWSVSTDGNNFIVGAKTDDDNGQNSGSAYVYMKDTEDQNPAKPSIDGPSSGKAGTSYDYTFRSTDPNDDDVYYYIEWGDGQKEEWIGPYNSGEEVTIAHIWDNKGSYTIRAKAKDTQDFESQWGTLEISMPRNRISSSPLLLRFLERLNQCSTILDQLQNLR